MKVTLFGKEYDAVIASPGSPSTPPSKSKKKGIERKKPKFEAPKPKDLHKEMTTQRVSRHYVVALLTRLTRDLKDDGAELVDSDGDRYVSMHSGDAEVLIAPIVDSDAVSLNVERVAVDGGVRMFGSVAVDAETVYPEMLDLLRKFVKRAKAR
jgi:hypothetical protein